MRHVTTRDGLTFRPHTFFNRLSGRTCSSTSCGFLAAIRRSLAFQLGLCGRGTFMDNLDTLPERTPPPGR
jgi:hypothetical protein